MHRNRPRISGRAVAIVAAVASLAGVASAYASTPTLQHERMSNGSEFFYDATTGAAYTRFYKAGRLVEEHAMRVHRVNGRLVYQLREIDHVHRTYKTPSGTTELFTPTDHAAELRAFVRSGVLRITGRTTLAGHDALILTSRPGCLKCQRWVVDAASYQQLRLTTTVPRFHRSLTTDFGEVPRTDAALAAMWPAIPAGYVRASDARGAREARKARKARHGKRGHHARHGKRHRAARG